MKKFNDKEVYEKIKKIDNFKELGEKTQKLLLQFQEAMLEDCVSGGSYEDYASEVVEKLMDFVINA